MINVPVLEPPLTDGVIVLRHWRPDDAAAVAQACGDPEIQRWTRVPGDYTVSDARKFITAAEFARRLGRSLEVAVVDADDTDHVLGAIGIVHIDGRRRDAQIGYWTSDDARGRGVAWRALILMTDWAFEQLRLTRLYTSSYVGNTSSQRVAQKAGYRHGGVLKDHLRTKEGRVDAVVYAAESSTWARADAFSALPDSGR